MSGVICFNFLNDKFLRVDIHLFNYLGDDIRAHA